MNSGWDVIRIDSQCFLKGINGLLAVSKSKVIQSKLNSNNQHQDYQQKLKYT